MAVSFFDALECRDPEERERDLLSRLPAQIAHAKAGSAYFARALAAVEPAAVNSRAALAQLPVLRKSALSQLQQQAKPFAGLTARPAATPFAALRRVFASPGPIYEPQGEGGDWWRFARALFAAGFRAGDLVHNTFAYHFTPAGFMVDAAARQLGCCVFPAGTGQSELQVSAIADLRPRAYAGTPSFLKIIIEKADELQLDIASLRVASVSGEALFPAQRELFAARGVKAYQSYGSADLGLIAYESEAREGLILGEELIVEIVRPGSGDPVAPGEVGEVVVTTFNPDYPLIRFGTGDLSALLPGISPCGRSNLRIKGWLGRADQTTKVKGMFVHPEQVASVVKRHSEIAKARLVVTNAAGNDLMTLYCEGAGAAAEIAATLRDVTKLRGEVSFVAPGTLANDGKVIEDARKYD